MSHSAAGSPTSSAEPAGSAHMGGELSHGPLEDLEHLIHHAAHFLPSQGPIQVFVHHNTLHNFEDLPFEEAVKQGAATYNCQPFLLESQYRQYLTDGRIRLTDLSTVLLEDLGDDADQLVSVLGTRYTLRLAMLQHPVRVATDAELHWHISESDSLRRCLPDVPPATRRRLIDQTQRWVIHELRGDEPSKPALNPRTRASLDKLFRQFQVDQVEFWNDTTWEAFTLNLLWQFSLQGVQGLPSFQHEPPALVRHRDLLLRASGRDSDQLVNEVLIPFCAAFLDQGMATWTLPERDQGFFRSFCAMHHDAAWLTPRWQKPLRNELARVQQSGMTPLESIHESLQLLGVPPDRYEAYITRTLLALRGWAGMIWQMETNAEWTIRPAPAGTLVDYLAVRLILDRLAYEYVAHEELDFRGRLSSLWEFLAAKTTEHDLPTDQQRAFRVFQLAQQLGWSPPDLARLTRNEWLRLIRETETFNGWERRRIYHLAFERRYRNQTLDAITAHNRRPDTTPARPRFQVITCIDEREESFRRHLEEQAPDCETFGVAGFFGVAMYYRGIAEAHYVPLCPIVIKPRHYVAEDVAYTMVDEHRRKELTRRVLGRASHRWHVGTRSFLYGVLTSMVGPLATFPLVARILFPRLTARIRRTFGSLVQPPAVTQLQLERTTVEPGSAEDQIGFSVEEMAGIVERVLRDIGLTSNFSPVIVIAGHGSSSLNNPHRAAYDCGACGGGRGGPNARAFAKMANDPRVREILASRGLTLSYDVYFVGALHNTCDDGVTYYDLELLPVTHRKLFSEVHAAIEKARQWNAHERCRRFESAPLTLTAEAALRHVEGRSEDMSQTRPECGHATNAINVVGRRRRSRNLYMDRRAFLTSYDPTQDDEDCAILTRILQAVIPVCAGINLEYYFSYVDSPGFGCGTKLPHNITSLVGVMDGAASDLRPGLPWQMVEIHEPVRLLFVIETTPEKMIAIMDRNPPISRLCRNRWVQLAVLDPDSPQLQLFQNGQFVPYQPEEGELPVVARSVDWYRGLRNHLGFAGVQPDSPTTEANESNHGGGTR
ncbi:MAG: DUF2309 domain-containing protein [Pirellulales bacterium]